MLQATSFIDVIWTLLPKGDMVEHSLAQNWTPDNMSRRIGWQAAMKLGPPEAQIYPLLVALFPTLQSTC